MTMLVLLQAMKPAEPFFSDDPIGFLKFIGSMVLAMSPLFGLVVWWMRRGPDDKIARLDRDLGEIGKKVDAADKARASDAARMAEWREQQVRSDAEARQFVERLTRVETAHEKLERTMTEHQQELTALILDQGRAHLQALHDQGRLNVEAMHKLELQIVQLNERANIADCLSDLGKNLERAVRMAIHKEERATP